MDPLLFSALTFCLGLILGHWLSLGRDLRKEFNEITEPLKLALRKEREIPNHPGPYAEGISEHQAATVQERLPRWRRARFEAAYRAYATARTAGWVRDRTGAWVATGDTQLLKDAITHLLSFMKHR